MKYIAVVENSILGGKRIQTIGDYKQKLCNFIERNGGKIVELEIKVIK